MTNVPAKGLMQGHDIMELERFLERTKHMITFDVLSDDSPVGFKGERYRLFLSPKSYQEARNCEHVGKIKITSHAAVVKGKLFPNQIRLAAAKQNNEALEYVKSQTEQIKACQHDEEDLEDLEMEP